MLAPHSRGIITFHEHKVSKDSILELQHFSHVFVVFVFHLNSNANVRQNTFGNDNNANKKQHSKRQFPSKIAPPSLGGKKVGVFSTRTPHRPNPIGFSLCKLDKVVVNNSKSGPTFSLLVSGLDIVDGTPVLDIKPLCRTMIVLVIT
jgi:tRNA (Thr-GGU) A37 N-methylase